MFNDKFSPRDNLNIALKRVGGVGIFIGGKPQNVSISDHQKVEAELVVMESEFNMSKKIKKLNDDRYKELNSFTLNDILMNENLVKTMAVRYSVLEDDDVINWINIHNQKVQFTKVELGMAIKNATLEIEKIYFKYRSLKDEVIANG